ncbi:MAG: zinc-ribbon domain-containing protein [Thermoplasmata archaeon]
MSQKVCQNCNHVNAENAKFCMNCGKKIDDNPKITEKVDKAEKSTNSQQDLTQIVDNVSERKKLAESLGQTKGLSMDAIRKNLGMLMAMLEDENALVREAAVRASVNIGKVNDEMALEVIPLISEMISDTDKFVRVESLKGLGALCTSREQFATIAAPKVIECLADADAGVRYRAILVMDQIGSAFPKLFKSALVILQGIADNDVDSKITRSEARSVKANLEKKLKDAGAL